MQREWCDEFLSRTSDSLEPPLIKLSQCRKRIFSTGSHRSLTPLNLRRKVGITAWDASAPDPLYLVKAV
jgi:hypothetical protein